MSSQTLMPFPAQSSTATAPLAITALGAVTPLGFGVQQFWRSLIAGECGIDVITKIPAEDLAWLPVRIAGEVPNEPLERYMPKKLIRQTDPFSQYAFVAGAEALEGHEFKDRSRVGLVMATAMGAVSPIAQGQATLCEAHQQGGRLHVSPRFVPRVLGNIAAAYIAMEWELTGPSLTLSTACASGNDALIVGASMIENGSCDEVLCVGADSVLTPVVIDSLANLGALSRSNDDPAKASRPFDQARNGFVIGEGGGAILLTRLDLARERGDEIYALLRGWASNNDAYSIIAPKPGGAQVKACMKATLARAGFTPDDVDYINAHGTATEAGDAIEAEAIAELFGKKPWVSSTKGATGHMMAAGGITEAIACIEALNTGDLPPNLNLENPCADLRFVDVGTRDESVRVALSNASGFGGQNACVLMSAYEG